MAGAHRLGEPVDGPMRALALPAAALALAGAVVLVGGRMVESPIDADAVAIDRPDAEAIAAVEAPVASTDIAPSSAEAEPASGAQALRAPQASVEPDTQAIELQPALAPSRMVAPAIVAPPGLAAGEVEWLARIVWASQ